MEYADIIQQALDTAERLGAPAAEALIAESVGLDIEVSEGRVENLSRSVSIGLGVRTLTEDGRAGIAYTSELSGGVQEVVEAAWANSSVTDPDPYNLLPETSETSSDDWVEEDPAAVNVEDKIAMAKAIEDRVLAADERITRVDRAGYSDSLTDYAVGNSKGLLRRYRRSHCDCAVVAAGKDPEGGDAERDWEFDVARRFVDLRPMEVADGCVGKVVRQLGGAPCATKSMPVVLDRYVTCQFLQVISASLCADNVLKGKSLFAKLLGEQVASDAVTIIDRNDHPDGVRPAPFDGEGVSAQETGVLRGGRLETFLHNTYTAAKTGGGAVSTANARRGLGSSPAVGPSNLYLEPSARSFETLLQEAGEGLYVTNAMGVHTADAISGDFSFGASGLLIDKGELGRPVRGVTIAGNIKDLLLNVVAPASDLRFFGAHGAPSALVSSLMVSGE